MQASHAYPGVEEHFLVQMAVTPGFIKPQRVSSYITRQNGLHQTSACFTLHHPTEWASSNLSVFHPTSPGRMGFIKPQHVSSYITRQNGLHQTSACFILHRWAEWASSTQRVSPCITRQNGLHETSTCFILHHPAEWASSNLRVFHPASPGRSASKAITDVVSLIECIQPETLHQFLEARTEPADVVNHRAADKCCSWGRHLFTHRQTLTV